MLYGLFYFSGWDQNDSYVKVFVTLPNIETLPSENIRCNFEDT